MIQELSFWLAVMAAAIAGVALFKLAAASAAGDTIPGLRPLADLISA